MPILFPPIRVKNSPLEIIEVVTYDTSVTETPKCPPCFDVFTVVVVRNVNNGEESELSHYMIADHPECFLESSAYMMANNSEAFDETTRIRDLEVALREAVNTTLESEGIRFLYGIGVVHFGEDLHPFDARRYTVQTTYSEETDEGQRI